MRSLPRLSSASLFVMRIVEGMKLDHAHPRLALGLPLLCFSSIVLVLSFLTVILATHSLPFI